MQAIGGFEEEFRQRLRAELDAVSVRLPPPRLSRRARVGGYYWVGRPLAIAVMAALALGVLATSVTGSPDPGVWMRALGVAPPSPEATPSPSTSPSPSPEQSQSPEPQESPHPESPEPEPSEHVNGSPEPRESGQPAGGDGPDG